MSNTAEAKTDSSTILDFLKKKIEIREQLNPEIWLEAASRLVVLLGDEEAKLYDLQQKAAQLKVMFLDSQEKRNISEAKTRIEASNEYKEFKKQQARVSQIEQFIMVSKLRAKIASGIL